MNSINTQSGLSIVATILALLIFSLFIAVAVSLVTTGAHIGVQETQGQQAFYIAEGGIHYAAVTLNFPNYVVDPAVNLGNGSFTTSVPTLSSAIIDVSPIPSKDVSSTEGFLMTNNPSDTPPNQYWVMLCDTLGNPTPNLTVSSTCEKISFTGKTATSFTTGTRGRHSSSAALHLANAVVLTYSWNTSITTTLNNAMSASTSKLCVVNTLGFTMPGFIQIADTNPTENQTEDVFCRNIGAPAVCSAPPACPGACFAGCTRNAFNGNGNGPAHSSGITVYQSEIGVLTTSTGVVPNVLTSSVRRTVQVNAGPSEE